MWNRLPFDWCYCCLACDQTCLNSAIAVSRSHVQYSRVSFLRSITECMKLHFNYRRILGKIASWYMNLFSLSLTRPVEISMFCSVPLEVVCPTLTFPCRELEKKHLQSDHERARNSQRVEYLWGNLEH